MMLTPCPRCRRHVRVVSHRTRCPFCGATVDAAPPRARAAARLSRAAVFAGATLASCTPAPPATHATPPPPHDGRTTIADALPDAAVRPDAPLADAAPPADAAPAPVGTAILRGTVKFKDGTPIAGTPVRLLGLPRGAYATTTRKADTSYATCSRATTRSRSSSRGPTA